MNCLGIIRNLPDTKQKLEKGQLFLSPKNEKRIIVGINGGVIIVVCTCGYERRADVFTLNELVEQGWSWMDKYGVVFKFSL